MAPHQVQQSGGAGSDLYYSRMGKASSSNNTVTESLYLDSGKVRMHDASNFDVLALWKQNKTMFLVLAAMTRDLLTIPMFSVASKQAFSAD
ncbi:hypothetical protein ES708_30012 [subsurface metagenome]